MNLRYFVSGSAAILAGWLSLTFVLEVPSQRYPKLQKHGNRDQAQAAAVPATGGDVAENSSLQAALPK
jgi:hypothetical protein